MWEFCYELLLQIKHLEHCAAVFNMPVLSYSSFMFKGKSLQLVPLHHTAAVCVQRLTCACSDVDLCELGGGFDSPKLPCLAGKPAGLERVGPGFCQS